MAITKEISGRLEWDYTDYNSINSSDALSDDSISISTSTVRAKLAYNF